MATDPMAHDVRRSSPLARVTSILTAVLALAMSATVAQGAPAVTGDQAAWKEVGAAYRKLQTLVGYRMLVATGRRPNMVFEVVPPASIRMTVPAGNGSMETITVNGQSRFRVNAPGGPGPWQCQGSPSIEFPENPSETLQGTVDVLRGADTAIAGTAVRTYNYRYAATSTTLYVARRTGLPRRAVTSGGGEDGDVTIDFYDYGAKIDIPLPPCPGG